MKRIYFGIYCILLTIFLLIIPAYAMEMSWTQATDNAAFSPRGYFSMDTFNGKMWVIGGLDKENRYHNDVWYSADGVIWNLATGSAAFSPRYGHTTVVFDNKLWVIGGYDLSHQFRNDVWYSSDGITWTQATQRAAFQPRVHHTSVVYDGKMWVIGGEITEHPWVHTNDVWYSSDGITWTQATGSPPFSPRAGHSSAVFDNKMWILGGVGDAYGKVRYNDVWYSSDGKQWNLKTNSARFSPRYYFTSSTAANNIWVIGGVDGEMTLNDVWSTSDGKTWLPLSSGKRFSPRFGHGAVVFNDHIWVVGGFDRANRYFNDVWYSSEFVSSPSAVGIVVNKTVLPWSIKQGTDARVSITFSNAGNFPVHDIEILDTTLPEFPVISGNNQTVIPQTLMPNETRIIVYTVHATEAGRFILPGASVLYAGEDGNYHKIVSNSPSIEVIAPLLSPTNSAGDKPGFSLNEVIKGITSFFSPSLQNNH